VAGQRPGSTMPAHRVPLEDRGNTSPARGLPRGPKATHATSIASTTITPPFQPRRWLGQAVAEEHLEGEGRVCWRVQADRGQVVRRR
jgi:hypothetical protein